jgi:hypothetical protein
LPNDAAAEVEPDLIGYRPVQRGEGVEVEKGGGVSARFIPDATTESDDNVAKEDTVTKSRETKGRSKKGNPKEVGGRGKAGTVRCWRSGQGYCDEGKAHYVIAYVLQNLFCCVR